MGIAHQIEMEEAIRESNRKQEEVINLQAIKGGIPQDHKWQPKTSIDAFKSLKAGKRYMQIIECLRKAGEPLTDRQIKEHLGLDDLNMVRPRVSELIDFRFIKKVATRICPVTNKRVRIVVVNEEELKYFLTGK